MKRLAFPLIMAVCCLIVLQSREARTEAQQAIANVTIPVAETIDTPEEARAQLAATMKALLPYARNAGATAIHLESDAYTLSPQEGHFAVYGNLFIDIVPESSTQAFVQALQKKGIQATINRFQQCRPQPRASILTQ